MTVSSESCAPKERPKLILHFFYGTNKTPKYNNHCSRHHKKYSGYILHLPQPPQNAVVESTSIVGTMEAMNFKNTTR